LLLGFVCHVLPEAFAFSPPIRIFGAFVAIPADSVVP